jgi:hypothetical protein
MKYCAATGKRVFVSEKEAKRLAARIIGNRIRVYACPHCRGLHVTHGERRSKT